MTTTEPTHFGRSAEDWDRLVESATAFLIERARLGKVTSYTELNATLIRRTGLRGFEFDREGDRAAVGYLLRLFVEGNRPTTGLLISALVNYLDKNDAGPGFYSMAQEFGLMPRSASSAVKWEFWVSAVADVQRYYGGANRASVQRLGRADIG